MPSRFWLFLAFIAAFGATKAHAQSAPKLLAVTLDQATVVKLPAGASTLIVGNPMIADVTMLKTGAAMVVTGKGYGQTNLIALNFAGRGPARGAAARPACQDRGGLAERNVARILFLPSRLHADGAARRRPEKLQ